MALIQCAECGKPMSQHAAACPHCGSPNTAAQQPQPQQPQQQWQQQQMQPTQAAPVAEEKPLVNDELASIMLLGYIAIWLLIIILFKFWEFSMYSDDFELLIYAILSYLPSLALPIVALTIRKATFRNIAIALSVIIFGFTAYNIFNIYVSYK